MSSDAVASVESDLPVQIAIVPKYRFVKVVDGRGREIDGLWQRNSRFYYQTSIPGKGCRRIPLLDEHNQPVVTISTAKEAIERLKRNRREGEMPLARRAPEFSAFADHYLAWVQDTGAKKAKTIAQEKSSLEGWKDFLGTIRLTQITRKHVNDYVLLRKSAHGNRRGTQAAVVKQGVGARTVNLDVLILRNCLKFGKDEGLIPGKLPTEGWKPLRYNPEKRRLLRPEDSERLCAVAVESKPDNSPRFRNGELLADALKFMASTGARVTSALATLWSDVDWENRQVRLRKTKYGKQNIVVDFNPALESLLRAMHGRRLPDTDAMFPATRHEGSVGSLRQTFEKVREAAGLNKLGFHDLRHYFISCCVMSGVDFMTIARWVGHEDGGILVAKVYGHLSNEHAQRQAEKVSFGASIARPDDSSLTPVIDLQDVEAAVLLQALQRKLGQ